ncbi:MAG: hypothetical protein JOZ24_05460 [Candidatus Eremiobacteraeota bacterium]|nr:hypothetical protein [Candidatus Eremiobacteraeota bacterium]
MTDEAVFYRRFIQDIRRCGTAAPACVAEVESRIAAALAAPSRDRDGRWARVVAGVRELLAGLDDSASLAAARLRTFVRENADLDRPRDVAITDFRFAPAAEEIRRTSDGRRLLVFARIARAAAAPALDEIVPGPTRRLAEWAVYGLCGGAAFGALWFAFIVPV